MVRYLKIKGPIETRPALSNSSLNVPDLTRAQRISASLKEIQSTSLTQEVSKEPKVKIPSRPHPHYKKSVSPTVNSPERHSDNLENKLHELTSKLEDYQEQVRKKETALKLAQQLNKEEIEKQPLKKKLGIFKNKEDEFKPFHFSSLRKSFSRENGVIFIVSILGSLIMTHSFFMLTQNRFEKAFVYRPKLNKEHMNPQMVNRLAAYMVSDRMLTEIIEKSEKLSPDETFRRQQLDDWIVEYRQHIQVFPNAQQGVIQLNIKWDNQEKAGLIARKITNAYLEIINTQESMDDYLQYFKKAVDKSASFKTRDKVILLNTDQKNFIQDLFVKKQQEYKGQLTSLEQKSANLKKKLPLAKEEKYLTFLSNPQSIDDYIIVALRNRLFDLESAAFVTQETGSDTVHINDLSRKLQQIRSRIEHLIQARLGKELNPDERRDLYLTMKKMRIEMNIEILSMVLAGQYGLQSDFSINQREYLVSQRKIYKLLHNYSTYISSKKRLSEVFDPSGANQNDQLDQKSFSLWKIYQQRFIYAIGLSLGILLGCWLIIFRNKRKMELNNA